VTLAYVALGGALGAVVRWLQVSAVPPEIRPFLTIGLLGAFTTFSTFSYETVALLQEGQWLRAGLYVGGSVALGLIAMVAGMAVVTTVVRAGGGA
jgi:CrcB protein